MLNLPKTFQLSCVSPTFAFLKFKKMKTFGLILLLALGIVSCQSSDQKVGKEISKKHNNTPDTTNFTSIEWLDSIFIDLGKANEGQIVEVAFRFKNTGDKNLIIEEVHAGCGCTVPETPLQPFAPGETGVIKAKFDSKDRVGVQNKYVDVRANTAQRSHRLDFKIEVVSPSK